ncbi:spore protein [Paenibacillus mesophilus]|nr:spore protein [Paenibacillus mesophilus]
MAQRRQAGQNGKNRGDAGLSADKKLNGPNRPSV